MAQRVLFADATTLSEEEEANLQVLAAQTQRTPPLTPESAYLKSRDALGGEGFVRAREELNRLDKIDKRAERALNDYEERLERGYTIGRILPNNAITLRRLFLEHQRAREAYNDAARRFESHLLALRTPEARRLISQNAEKLLREDQSQRHTVAEAASRIEMPERLALAPARLKNTLSSQTEGKQPQKIKVPKP